MTVTITVNGQRVNVPSDASVAAALLNAGVRAFRTAVTGEARGPLCGMGICFECRVTVDGVEHERSCLVTVREGMSVVTAVAPRPDERAEDA